MGQYHVSVDLDRREYVHPHALGDGLKLAEQAGSGPGGVGTALIVLLAASNGYGGGDFRAPDPNGVVGRWAGDRVAIVGDYAEPSDLAPEHEAELVYDLCGTREEVLRRAAHLVEYAKRSGRHEHAERAARLQEREPYRDITPLVRAYLEREGIASTDKARVGSPGLYPTRGRSYRDRRPRLPGGGRDRRGVLAPARGAGRE